MINDFLSSVRDNIRDKTGNPFFGALIILWSIKNWNLIYSILNFDESTSLVQKRKFIIQHFTDRPFLKTLAFCVLEVLLILIISYFFINLSRLIVNLYEKRVTPYIYKWTDSNSIVLKSVLIKSEEKRSRLEKRLEEERLTKLNLQDDYEKLEKRYRDLLDRKVQESAESLKADEAAPTPASEKGSEESKADLILMKLRRDGELLMFKTISERIQNSEPIDPDDFLIKELVVLGVVERIGPSNTYKFDFTDLGYEVFEKFTLERLKGGF